MIGDAGLTPIWRAFRRSCRMHRLRFTSVADTACGGCNKSIARRLGISSHTVGAHIGRILAKLAVHKRTELAACVARHLQAES